MTSNYRIGVDVGGTNTDAVLVDSSDRVIKKTKTPTTSDITTGLTNALGNILDCDVNKSDINHVMLGTTHCTNAVTERRNLNDVGVIRVGAPATKAVEPLFEWPDDLSAAVGNHTTIIGGGHEFNGEEITSLDKEAAREFLRNKREEIDSVAITSVFSPVIDDHEQCLAKIAREELGQDIPVSISSEIGSIGLLERENATVLNAALTNVIREASSGFRAAMEDYGLDAQLHFGQNDGTLMSVSYAEEYPIYTVACGPANSIRGAAYLSGVENGLIIDVGGTTTDIGSIADGFPRQSAVAVEIGGVTTNFRMPDLVSVGIGGGSLVKGWDGETLSEITVGPKSVGYQLTKESRVFGGDQLTATDIAVALGRANVGSRKLDLVDDKVRMADEYMTSEVNKAIEKMKTSQTSDLAVLVGGGSIILPDSFEGVSDVQRPENHDVANAIGAAISQVSGHVDRVFSLEEKPREQILKEAKESARENAVEAGADPNTVEIVDQEEVPLAYLPGDAVRVKIQAAGDLKIEGEN